MLQKRGHLVSVQTILTGVLQHAVYCSKNLWGVLSDSWPVTPQPIFLINQAQIGVSRLNQETNTPRRLCLSPRPQKYILSQSHLPSRQEVVEVHLERESLPLHIRPFRSEPITLDVYHISERPPDSLPTVENIHPCLLG